MSVGERGDAQLKWELLIKKRGSATQGVPPGKEPLAWVTNAVTLITEKNELLLVDTFLSRAHNEELANWTAAKGTRANVMKQAANLKDFEPAGLLPGIKINTSATDFYPIEQLQMMRFKGESWECSGPLSMAKSEAKFANVQADESFGAGCNTAKCDLERTTAHEPSL
jgi:hypothetical protein